MFTLISMLFLCQTCQHLLINKTYVWKSDRTKMYKFQIIKLSILD